MKNRRILLTGVLSAALLFTATLFETKAQLHEVGDNEVNFTVGIGSPWILGSRYNKVGLPAIAISLDHGFRDDLGPGVLSIGAIVGATTYKEEVPNYGWIYDYGRKYTSLLGAARATYHYQFIDELDTYGGIHAGLRLSTRKLYGNYPTYYDPNLDLDVKILANFFVGAKYYLSDNLFVLGEVGFSIAYLNFGVGVKL